MFLHEVEEQWQYHPGILLLFFVRLLIEIIITSFPNDTFSRVLEEGKGFDRKLPAGHTTFVQSNLYTPEATPLRTPLVTDAN